MGNSSAAILSVCHCLFLHFHSCPTSLGPPPLAMLRYVSGFLKSLVWDKLSRSIALFLEMSKFPQSIVE